MKKTNILILMVLSLSCNIVLGSTSLDFCHSVKITKSIESLSDTATIVIPRNIEAMGSTTKLLDHIQEGNNVTIDLGYNDELRTEFKGYITSISGESNIVISCEDEMYKLRQVKCDNTIYKDIKLSDFVNKITKNAQKNKGYTIHCEVETTLEKFTVENASAYEVLVKLQEQPFYFYSFFDKDKELYVGFAYPNKDRHKYTYDNNFIKDKLHYNTKNNEIKIKGVSHFPKGKKIVKEEGEGSSIRVLNYFKKDANELETLIKAHLQRVKATKYEGSIIGFGWPKTEPGHHLIYANAKNADKEGTYLIDEVKVSFGESGYRRENILKFKLS